ncbi:hypothetical protein F4779DRAFT_603355 [Xylariaceae sp. FL0662B]|nr:hypothetical protein F4779DRAFT_603355 [Xylariaceae sp. FL0662B]
MPEERDFPSFLRLPIEIRRLIWRHALPRGRIQLFARNVPWEDWCLPAPPAAHVCRESRQVVLSYSVVRGFPTAQDNHTTTWFIGCFDILELHSGYPYPLSNPEPFFSAAQRIAINAGDFEGEIKVVIRDLIEGTRFHSVKVVYLIVEQIETAYWPKFRPDMTERDRGKGTILDLWDGRDQEKIEAYKAWARDQEMSPVFPRREDVELTLRSGLDKAIMEGLRDFREKLLQIQQGEGYIPSPGQLSVPTGASFALDDPWAQHQVGRLPEFRPAILVLGWP